MMGLPSSSHRNANMRKLARVGLALCAALWAVLPVVDARLHRSAPIGKMVAQAVSADLPGCALCAAIQTVAEAPPALVPPSGNAVEFASIADREHRFVHRTPLNTALPRGPPIA